MPKNAYYRIVIIGGGSAGISVAARLIRLAKELRGNVMIIDPATKHYYQPLWTLVGGGVVKKETTQRDQASVIPEGVGWLQDAVTCVEPRENYVISSQGDRIAYDFLVVAAGLQTDWEQIKGLKESIGKDGVCSNYSYDYVDSTWEAIRSFRGGNAIFTHPNTPIKCGGAPQKIMYLADDAFRRAGVREQSQVIFASANASIFAVKKYADALNRVIDRKGIVTKYRRNLIELRAASKEAVFLHLDSGEQEILPYQLIHVVPPMSVPAFLKKSMLTDAAGWVDVHKETLQHNRFANVFALGDCSNLPTSKTGAAIRKQAPVLVSNLLAAMQGKTLEAVYDGYTSCPLVTGYNRLVLAEFDYNQTPRETFPFDQSKERYSMYLLKKDVLPMLYWKGMLKGRM